MYSRQQNAGLGTEPWFRSRDIHPRGGLSQFQDLPNVKSVALHLSILRLSTLSAFYIAEDEPAARKLCGIHQRL